MVFLPVFAVRGVIDFEGVVAKLGQRLPLVWPWCSKSLARSSAAVRYTRHPVRVNPLEMVFRICVFFTGASVLAASGLWEGGLHSTQENFRHGSVPQSESLTKGY